VRRGLRCARCRVNFPRACARSMRRWRIARPRRSDDRFSNDEIDHLADHSLARKLVACAEQCAALQTTPNRDACSPRSDGG